MPTCWMNTHAQVVTGGAFEAHHYQIHNDLFRLSTYDQITQSRCYWQMWTRPERADCEQFHTPTSVEFYSELHKVHTSARHHHTELRTVCKNQQLLLGSEPHKNVWITVTKQVSQIFLLFPMCPMCISIHLNSSCLFETNTPFFFFFLYCLMMADKPTYGVLIKHIFQCLNQLFFIFLGK